MTTPNLDVTQHQWVESLARFMLSIEYQKGYDNAAADSLSRVTSKLNAKTVKSILDGITMGTTERTNAHDLAGAKAHEEIHKPVQKTVILTQGAHKDLHMSVWVAAQQEDQILGTVIKWISGQKVTGSKTPAGRWCKY